MTRMTREEAYNILSAMLRAMKTYEDAAGRRSEIILASDKTVEALQMAADALQTDPCEICQKVKTTFKQTANEWGVTCEPIAEPCDDCISREAVDKLSKDLVHVTRDKADFLCNFWEGLNALPPVVPRSKTRKWWAI